MKKTTRTLVYCLFALQLVMLTACSQGLLETTPESIGLSQERLADITALMQKHVDDKYAAGIVELNCLYQALFRCHFFVFSLFFPYL